MVHKWDLGRYGIDKLEVVITQDKSDVDVNVKNNYSDEFEFRKYDEILAYVISDMKGDTSRFLNKSASPDIFHSIVMEIVNKIKEAEEKWIRGKI